MVEEVLVFGRLLQGEIHIVGSTYSHGLQAGVIKADRTRRGIAARRTFFFRMVIGMFSTVWNRTKERRESILFRYPGDSVNQ